MVRVHYAELRGEGARAALLGWMEALGTHPGCLGAELLSSPAQPGLFLVMSRWTQEPPALSLPTGARQWTFLVEVEARPWGAGTAGSDEG